MAASDFLPDRIVSVYHTPKDIDDLDKFVDSLGQGMLFAEVNYSHKDKSEKVSTIVV